MVVKPIVRIGEDILRQKSESVKEFGTSELRKLRDDLRDTLINFRNENSYGRGISAVQIGILKQVIYVETDEFDELLINPRIISKSHKGFGVWDSCFSANIAFFIKVLRNYEIEIEYFDIDGKKKVIKAKGSLSELLQHEIDHLLGKLFIDYLDEKKQMLLMREVYEKNKYK